MRHVLRWIGLGLLVITTFAGIVTPSVDGQENSTPTAEAQALLPVDEFYDLPSEVSAPPGTLLRFEPLVDRQIPPDSQAWRIQYVTSMPDGSPAVAVATVLAPTLRPPSPMPVVAWDHGTIGLVQRCLPSLTTIPFAAIPAIQQAIAQRWVVVAPDYQTDAKGIHPFLIGEGEARSTLDAVRAARQLAGLQLDPRTVVWGHSQGGHAALWTATLAPNYAPDVPVVGAVAIAPAADLLTLLDMHGGDAIASGIGAYLVNAYSAFYPDVSYEEAVRAEARETGQDLATRCPLDPQDTPVMGSLIEALGGEPLLTMPPTAGLAARLDENTPVGPFSTPLVIAQGLADEVVYPEATDAWVAARCADDISVEYWRLPVEDHRSIVASGSSLEVPLVEWTRQRFADGVPASTCSTVTISA